MADHDLASLTASLTVHLIESEQATSMMYPGGILAWAADFLTAEIAEQIEVVPMSEVAGLVVQPDEPVE